MRLYLRKVRKEDLIIEDSLMCSLYGSLHIRIVKDDHWRLSTKFKSHRFEVAPGSRLHHITPRLCGSCEGHLHPNYNAFGLWFHIKKKIRLRPFTLSRSERPLMGLKVSVGGVENYLLMFSTKIVKRGPI